MAMNRTPSAQSFNFAFLKSVFTFRQVGSFDLCRDLSVRFGAWNPKVNEQSYVIYFDQKFAYKAQHLRVLLRSTPAALEKLWDAAGG